MGTSRIVGIVLLVLGVALLIVGLNAKDSVADQISETFTGNFTDETTWYLIGGIVLGMTGLAMTVMGVNKKIG